MATELIPLPSSDSARDLVLGKPDAFGRVVAHATGRSVLCGVGCYAAGLRGKELFIGAVAGALAIEIFAISWFWAQTKAAQVPGPAQVPGTLP